MRVSGLILAIASATLALAHPGVYHDIEALTERIAREPSNAELYLERANRERLAGGLELALVDLERAESLCPEDRRVAAERGLTLETLGRAVDAERELTRFLDSGPPTEPVLEARARLRAGAGRQDEAVADLTAAIALRPDPDLYLERGRLQEALGRLEEAACGYREGLLRLGGAVALRSALLEVVTARGDWPSALTLLDEEISRAAVKTGAYLERAEILRAAGRLDEARADLERALLEADRDVREHPSGLTLFAHARVRIARGEIEEARSDLRQALRRSPRFSEAQELLATLSAADRARQPAR